MKKIKNSILMVFIGMITLFPTLFLFGQKDFSGVIVYNITFPESNFDAQTLAMMPKTAILKIKGMKSRTEMSMGMGGSTVSIFDSEKMEGITLMDMMGQKFAIATSQEDVKAEMDKTPDFKVEVTDETKEIAGYQCTKAIIMLEEGMEKGSHVAYFTDELGTGAINYSNPVFKDIQGVMLEYAIDQQGMKMLFSAISVEKKKISDEEFDVPEGFKNVTQEELQNMFGGGY
jgi:GLPGLI family protein